jgi:hypothetical protein
MQAPHLRCYVLVLVGSVLAGGSACVLGSSASLTINATVVEVQCTAEQRARIRACAPAQESYTVEPRKWLIDATVRTGAREQLVPLFEIRPDPERRVLVRTVLY